ncbi:MAG: DUF3168 domain-containing protein [Parvularcula sp.]|jgi:hypothetical protein|nr:DUF3168 domain-containing protein [Parvularcula sp.]
MSYAIAADLQRAVFAALRRDPGVTGSVGEAIYDVVPPGKIPSTYVSLGPEEVRDHSDKTGRGARHDFTISVVSDAAGFMTAKEAAAAISDALVDAELPLARGRLVSLSFLRAKALRDRDAQLRRIDLRFRAHVEDYGPISPETA